MAAFAQTLQGLFRRYRRPGDLVFAWAFLVACTLLLMRLDVQVTTIEGTDWYAQPSFWPTVSLWTMTGFAVLHLLGSALSPRIPGRWTEVLFWARSLEYVLWFLGYVALVPWLGYLPATVAFAVLLTLRTGFHSVRWVVVATLSGVAVVVIFRALLQVKIPAGRVYEHLPGALRAFARIYL